MPPHRLGQLATACTTCSMQQLPGLQSPCLSSCFHHSCHDTALCPPASHYYPPAEFSLGMLAPPCRPDRFMPLLPPDDRLPGRPPLSSLNISMPPVSPSGSLFEFESCSIDQSRSEAPSGAAGASLDALPSCCSELWSGPEPDRLPSELPSMSMPGPCCSPGSARVSGAPTLPEPRGVWCLRACRCRCTWPVSWPCFGCGAALLHGSSASSPACCCSCCWAWGCCTCSCPAKASETSCCCCCCCGSACGSMCC
mmetsp:Transcript_23127/g.50761  ORF Transcript_23127/g.50761 Transcript_23127/m.50761 type:complete len:253 (+) Transcript_23127:3257-4015(+)